MTLDPIVAVKDVEKSSEWYQAVFNCKSKHGGSEFDVLVSTDGSIFICLHKWNAHEHPTMKSPMGGTPGNGLILYFRTEHLQEIRDNLEKMNYKLEEEILLNPNSGQKEFSVRDLDGYYLTISEMHRF